MSELQEGETYGEYLERENRRHSRNREMFTGEAPMTVHEEIQARREQAETEEHQARLQYEDMIRERDEWARKFAAMGKDKGAPPSASVKVFAHKVPTTTRQCENDILLRQQTLALDREEYMCPRCRFNLWVPIVLHYTNVRVTSDGRNWHTL